MLPGLSLLDTITYALLLKVPPAEMDKVFTTHLKGQWAPANRYMAVKGSFVQPTRIPANVNWLWERSNEIQMI
jgi:hypothetical protein